MHPNDRLDEAIKQIKIVRDDHTENPNRKSEFNSLIVHIRNKQGWFYSGEEADANR